MRKCEGAAHEIKTTKGRTKFLGGFNRQWIIYGKSSLQMSLSQELPEFRVGPEARRDLEHHLFFTLIETKNAGELDRGFFQCPDKTLRKKDLFLNASSDLTQARRGEEKLL